MKTTLANVIKPAARRRIALLPLSPSPCATPRRPGRASGRNGFASSSASATPKDLTSKDGLLKEQQSNDQSQEADPKATLSTAANTAERTASTSAAAYLLAQAEAEEAAEDVILAEQKATERKRVTVDPDAWDGDETRGRMVRRILEDQYKPLRVKGFKKAIPGEPKQLMDVDALAAAPRSASSRESHHKFKAPDGWAPPPIHADPPTPNGRVRPPPTTGKVTRQARLSQAWERTLDYNAGFRGVLIPTDEHGAAKEDGGETPSAPARRVLGGMRAWEGIVEDKIQQAQRDGIFKNVKGRGKPLLRDLEAEANPYIPRDDFLINRIIKSQGVAPPWVELQQELETALSAFRTALRDTWIRRACRIQSLEGLTRDSIRQVEEGWRDTNWERMERSYHEASIHSINQIIRRYNIQAPFPVRRGLLSLQYELDAAIKFCIPAITWELERRLQGGKIEPLSEKQGEGSDAGREMEEQAKQQDRFWPALRRAVFEMLGVGGGAGEPQTSAAVGGEARK